MRFQKSGSATKSITGYSTAHANISLTTILRALLRDSGSGKTNGRAISTRFLRCASSVCFVNVDERLSTARCSFPPPLLEYLLAKRRSSSSECVRLRSNLAPRRATSDCRNCSICAVTLGMIRFTTRAGRSIAVARSRRRPTESCRTEETAVGKDGEDDISLYQVKTKSLTIMVRISLSAEETTGKSGTRGGNVCGGL